MVDYDYEAMSAEALSAAKAAQGKLGDMMRAIDRNKIAISNAMRDLDRAEALTQLWSLQAALSQATTRSENEWTETRAELYRLHQRIQSIIEAVSRQ